LNSIAATIIDENDRGVAELLINRGKYQIAAEFLTSTVPGTVEALIRKQFSDIPKTHAADQLAIGEMCPGTIVTTNYDRLIEQAYPQYKVASPIDDVYLLFSDKYKLLKLHGSVSAPGNCVLSVSQYARTYNRDLDYLLINLLTNQNLVFIGSSLDSGEPYFKHMAHIQRNALSNSKRWAILSFSTTDKSEITRRCIHYESTYGINVIPYIPSDSDHSCFRSILEHLRDRPPSKGALSEHLNFLRKQTDKFSSDISGAESLIPYYRRLSRLARREDVSESHKLEIFSSFDRYAAALFCGDDKRPSHVSDAAKFIFLEGNRINISFDSLYVKFKDAIAAVRPSESIEKILANLIVSAKKLSNFREDMFDIVRGLESLKANVSAIVKSQVKK
jgi:hypothetical protein